MKALEFSLFHLTLQTPIQGERNYPNIIYGKTINKLIHTNKGESQATLLIPSDIPKCTGLYQMCYTHTPQIICMSNVTKQENKENKRKKIITETDD